MILRLRCGRTALAIVTAVLAAIVVAAPAAAAPAWRHRGLSFTEAVPLTQEQEPENLAFDRKGNMYLSLFTSNEILKVAPDGTQTPFAANLPGSPTGIVVDPSGNIYVALVNFPSFSTDGGIWRIPAGGGTPELVATVPGAFPNGLAMDTAGNLYVAESFAGRVYKVSTDGTVTLWSASPLLAGTDKPGPCGKVHPFGAVGANGVAFDNLGNMLVTNTSVGDVIRIRVNREGSAGQARILAGPACPLWGADGLAVDLVGNTYVAANAEEDVVRVDPFGRIQVLASQVGGAPLSTPSGVAFGQTFSTARQVFVTNFAFFHGGDGSGVVKADVVIPGRRLP